MTESLPAPPAAPADDATFARRVYLDLVGRIPTVAEARAFLDDPAADKRAEPVDRLLGSPGYTAHAARRCGYGGVTASPPARVDRAGMISSAEYARNRTDPSANRKWAPPVWGDQKW